MPQSLQSGARSRDLLGYAGSPPDPRWPGGARVAVSIVVNFEEGAEFSVTDGDPENEAVYDIEQRLAGRLVADHGGARTARCTSDGEFERPGRRTAAAAGAGCGAPRPRDLGARVAVGRPCRSGRGRGTRPYRAR